MFSFNEVKQFIILSEMSFPSFVFKFSFSTRVLISLDVSSGLEARFLTSWSTTANPFPAFADSTSTFSDRIFV